MLYFCGVFKPNYNGFVPRNYTLQRIVFLNFCILVLNSFLDLAFIFVATIQRERDFCYFRSLFKNSNIGGTSEVSPVKFWGIGRSVFVLSRGASALGVGVGT